MIEGLLLTIILCAWSFILGHIFGVRDGYKKFRKSYDEQVKITQKWEEIAMEAVSKAKGEL